MTGYLIVTPAHYEVIVALEDTTSRLYRVIADSEEAAISHVGEIVADHRRIYVRMRRQEYREQFEVAR